MNPPACPTLDRLAHYCLGKLPWAEHELVEDHLEGCGICKHTVTELEQQSDSVLRGSESPAQVPPRQVAAAPASEPRRKRKKNRGGSGGTPSSQPNDQHREPQAPQTVAQLLALLEISQLKTAQQGQAFLNALPPAERPADARAAVALMANKGLITHYQARALYQGKPKHLVLADREILELIGKGGMGDVFKARNRRLDRIEAVKVIAAKKLDTPKARERFEREARAAARINSPYVVSTYDAGESDGVCYLCLEYIDGLDLAKTVKERGPLTVGQALACIRQVAEGLQAAHDAGIIHRDIKPHNLLLDQQGRAKILDLGLARLSDNGLLNAEEVLTHTGQVLGTVDYMSPEQMLDGRKVTPASDVYSLGCVLHFLLTGRPPFSADTLGAKMLAHQRQPPPQLSAGCPHASPALEAVFQKMLAKDPQQRFASMRDLLGALPSAEASPKPAAAFIPPQVARQFAAQQRPPQQPPQPLAQPALPPQAPVYQPVAMLPVAKAPAPPLAAYAQPAAPPVPPPLPPPVVAEDSTNIKLASFLAHSEKPKPAGSRPAAQLPIQPPPGFLQAPGFPSSPVQAASQPYSQPHPKSRDAIIPAHLVPLVYCAAIACLVTTIGVIVAGSWPPRVETTGVVSPSNQGMLYFRRSSRIPLPAANAVTLTVTNLSTRKSKTILFKGGPKFYFPIGTYSITVDNPAYRLEPELPVYTIPSGQTLDLGLVTVPPTGIPREAKEYPGNSNYYLFVPGEITHSQADAECRKWGSTAHLAIPDSPVENTFISRLAKLEGEAFVNAWIGVKRVGASWPTLSNKYLKFQNWYEGEPTGQFNETAVITNWQSAEKWNDHDPNDASAVQGYVVEWEIASPANQRPK